MYCWYTDSQSQRLLVYRPHLVPHEVAVPHVKHAPRQHPVPVIHQPLHQLNLVRNVCTRMGRGWRRQVGGWAQVERVLWLVGPATLGKERAPADTSHACGHEGAALVNGASTLLHWLWSNGGGSGGGGGSSRGRGSGGVSLVAGATHSRGCWPRACPGPQRAARSTTGRCLPGGGPRG